MAFGFAGYSELPYSALPTAAGPTAYVLTANPGSITYQGSAANLLYNRKIIAAAGSVTYQGAAATLAHNYRLTASPGSVTYQGAAANLLFNRRIIASPGSITYQGATATLTKSGGPTAYVLTALPGNVTYQGAVATLRWSGEAVPIGGGQPFAVGGGGGWKLGKVIEELEYVKRIEQKLKGGRTLRQAIADLKQVAPTPAVRKQVARVEKKALRQDPAALRFLAEQLRSVEAKATILGREIEEEDLTQEIIAFILEEEQQVVAVLKRIAELT